MHIVYIAKALIPSRTANSLHVMKMCQAFANNGHEVELFVLSEGKSQTNNIDSIYQHYSVKNNFRIIWIPVLTTRGSRLRYLFSSFILAGSITRRVILRQCDIVYGRNLLGCTLSALLGKKTIFESHAPIWQSQLEAGLFKLLIRLPRFCKLVVISDALRQVYLSRYPLLNHSNTMIAHDAADLPAEMTDTNLLQGDLKQLHVGYVGHLYKGKGIEVIAAVAPKISDVNFHVIGGLEEDIAYWQAEISSPNVFFYGFISQDKLPTYIHKIDVCLLPNQRHVSAFGAKTDTLKNISNFTSPLKMFEYMSYKKPIIASNLPVLREVLDEDISIFVDPEDMDGWRSAIERLKDGSIRQNLSNGAYRRFVREYTWKHRAEQILAGF